MKTLRFNSIILAAAVAVILLAAAACGSKSGDKPIVTVSLQPQKYMLEQITGDKIDVRCLLSNGGNPESYDPSFTHLLSVEKSLAYLRMGNIAFEDAIIDKIRNSRPDLPIYNTSEGIALISGTHHHHSDEPADGHTDVDPHTWTSVKNAGLIADNMLKAMIEIDPANKKYYTDNHRRFRTMLDSLDNRFERELAPHRGDMFIVWHPSLSYFARDYGLEQMSVGLENKEAGIRTLEKAISTARDHNARVFFFQKDFDSRQAEVINEQIGARKVIINPLGYDWRSEMENLVDALADTTDVSATNTVK